MLREEFFAAFKPSEGRKGVREEGRRNVVGLILNETKMIMFFCFLFCYYVVDGFQ